MNPNPDLLVILMPLLLVMARVTAFLMAAPIFGTPVVPKVVTLTLSVWLSVLMVHAMPPIAWDPAANWLLTVLAVVREAVIGLAIGLAAKMIFMAVQQGGTLLAQQMGLADASVIDPVSGEESPHIEQFIENAMTLLFLGAGGHLLLVALLHRGFTAFPPGATMPDLAMLADGLVNSGVVMLRFALGLAAPMIAAFLVLAVGLAVLARALPEMNILFESMPLRVGLGLLMTAAILPSMTSFVHEVASAMARILPSG